MNKRYVLLMNSWQMTKSKDRIRFRIGDIEDTGTILYSHHVGIQFMMKIEIIYFTKGRNEHVDFCL